MASVAFLEAIDMRTFAGYDFAAHVSGGSVSTSSASVSISYASIYHEADGTSFSPTGSGLPTSGTVTSWRYGFEQIIHDPIEPWQPPQIIRIPYIYFADISFDAGAFFGALSTNAMGSIMPAILSGDDTVTGSSGNDYLLSYNGEDTVDGGLGNDVLVGGLDDDFLTGGDGSDWLIGGAGDDFLNGGLGNDTASYSDAPSAVVVDLSGAPTQLTGGGGFDALQSIESLTGSSFNDRLTGDEIANTLTGAAGVDLLFGGLGNDSLLGGEGSDWLVGGEGNDSLNGGSGTDTASYVGSAAGVTVNLNLAGAQNTVSAGTDTLTSIEHLTGTSYNDALTGNANHNTLTGGLGTDIMTGNSGNDTLNGGDGGDGLIGNNGNDNLIGGNGSDTLVGGAGNDTLDSGTGSDVMRFDTSLSTVSNVDLIVNYSTAFDTIQLDDDIFTAAGALGTLAAGAFHVGGAAADASDRIIYNQVTGKLYYDADGAGGAAQILFAQLSAGLALTNADFTIIG